jgi:predicted PurR-regulated permease PerM
MVQDTDDPLPAALPAHDPDEHAFGWSVFEISCIAIAVLVVTLLLWFAIEVLLLLFGAVLVANVLRAPTEALARLGVSEGLALAMVVLAMLGLLTAAILLVIPEMAEQIPDLIDSLIVAFEWLRQRTGIDQWAGALFEDFTANDLIGGATNFLAATFGVITSLFIVIIIGIYLAATPGLYVSGMARLFRKGKRPRVETVLGTIGRTLRWWMIGQLISMSVVGVLTYAGLWLLEVPLALVLAGIAFLLTFIPVLGPILAAIPVLLVAFTQGLDVGLWILLLYVLIQNLEGYVITPLIQRRTVSLPPAMTISSQVLLGALVGVLGIALATPLAAATLVAVRMLYVEDVLGDVQRPA